MVAILAVALVAAAGAAHAAPVIFASPERPAVDRPLRVVAASDQPLDGTLALVAPTGERAATTTRHGGGPPWWWELDVVPRVAGDHRACLDAGGAPACVDVAVATAARPARTRVWPLLRDWNAATETLYAAWIARLFDDPLDAEPSWRGLDAVTRRPERNFLYDHLGLGEDGERGLRLAPDCADLPYFLRAYFAWKLGLPFGWSQCSRGGGGQPPRCGRWRTPEALAREDGGVVARMQAFLSRELAWDVQSGAGRAPAEDDATDLYPTRLSAETLRPGTVYADPYGHTLVVVGTVPETAASPGILLAVDAQPDETVARKRYWRGTFLFALDPALGSPGFKRFRPVVRDGGRLRPLRNREILLAPDWGDYSLEQYQAGVEGFYDRVDDVLSPAPLDAAVVFRGLVDALDEQVRTRIRSVANGEAFATAHPGIIAMPDGPAIFETTGAWEDYATPARDLRLLIAIDVVRGFPAKAAARPERFAAPADPTLDVRATLDAMLREAAATRRYAYVRSDGSPWPFTLGDVLARTEALEVAYNPNDCVEVRWGAPPDAPERATCRRRAPAEQAARMERHRAWFRDRTRPAR